MYKWIAMLIIGACVAGCATKNSTVNFSMWRSSAISGEENESSQEMSGGGEVDTSIPVQ